MGKKHKTKTGALPANTGFPGAPRKVTQKQPAKGGRFWVNKNVGLQSDEKNTK